MCYSKGEVIADGVSALLFGENNGNIITFELIDNNHYQDVVINIKSDYKVTKSLGRIGKLSTLSPTLLLCMALWVTNLKKFHKKSEQ